jgi:hypothetical protein
VGREKKKKKKPRQHQTDVRQMRLSARREGIWRRPHQETTRTLSWATAPAKMRGTNPRSAYRQGPWAAVRGQTA